MKNNHKKKTNIHIYKWRNGGIFFNVF